ncbi:FtsX-like permease family protein [Microbacterium sp.]|uniref:FtsX-like permease family protein n=1 Tax=Microbacterium sp. TaxID=51671 RepID=UPI0039E2D229
MIRLIVSDLVAHARVWRGTLAVTIAAGFVAAIAAGLIETGIAHGGRVQEGLGSTSAVIVVFTTVTALIVLSSTANLTVALQQRSYALWQLVGIRPALVGLVVLAQLGIVGILGAMIGCLIAAPSTGPLFAWSFTDWPTMQGVEVELTIIGSILVTAGIVAVTVVGGLRGARRASRTPPIEALRDPEPPRVNVGWFRIVLAAGMIAGSVGMIVGMNGATFSQISGMAPLLTPLIAGVLAAGGPVLYPLVLRAWTSLVPARASASWFLARNSARYRLSQSAAAVGPLMVAIALAGGLYTSGATLAAAQAEQTGNTGGFDLAPEGVVILLGGPLLLSAIGAAATVFMSGQAREREFALVQAAGSTQAAIVLTAIWEAVIYTITAAVLGTLATVVGGIVLAHALGLPLPTVSFATIGLIAGSGFVLILAATIAPTAAALRHEIPRTLAVE